ncbi:recombinase family protein [Kitasatospora sp. NPDC059408]|uniref:recombinase family protein n=1 Tax=Kitasatospora sp. NPDC059408 TaxID=3346823 RepID=UPI0036953D0A
MHSDTLVRATEVLQAGYLRQSQERQDGSDGSIQVQGDGVHATAAARPGRYVGDYIDRDSSAFKADSEREDFERLMADCRAGKVNEIIVYYISRFSRLEPKDIIPVVLELHRLGVTIVSCTEGVFPPDDTMSLLMLIMRLDAAHQESKNKSKHVRDTKRKLRNAGGWVGGLPPYGYCTEIAHVEVMTDDGPKMLTIRQLIVVEDEARVIQRIVAQIVLAAQVEAAMYQGDLSDEMWELAKKTSLSGICADLNGEEVPTKTARLGGKWRGAPNGKDPGREKPPQWEVTTLKRILMDPRLMGHAVEPIREKYETQNGRIRERITGYRTLRDEETGLPLIAHEAITGAADFYTVQAWIKSRGRGRGAPGEKAVLSDQGVLFCECSATMSSNGSSVPSYRCSRPKGGANPGEHEGGNNIVQVHANDFVALCILTKMAEAQDGDPIALDMMLAATRRYMTTMAKPEVGAEAGALTAEKADKQAALNELYDDKEAGDYDGPIGKRRFRERKAKLEAELEAIESRVSELATLEQPELPVFTWLEKDDPDGPPTGEGSWWAKAGVHERRAFVKLFVKRVEVTKATTRGNKWEEYDASKRVTVTFRSLKDDEDEAEEETE